MLQLGINSPEGIARATFTVDGTAIEVHFNPETLSLSLSRSVSDRGAVAGSKSESGTPAASAQEAGTFAVTLSMKLQFDTTDTGEDVRATTVEFQRMMRPKDGGQQSKKVLFHWGTFKFTGTFRSYTETIDFFSAEGVPLRASVDLSMSENQDVAPGSSDAGGFGFGFGISAGIEIGARAGVSVSASIGGDALSARAVAEFNGEESVRRLSGAPLEVNAGVSLNGPVAFATGSASFSASLGVGVSASASIGGGGGLGLQLGASAGIGAGVGIGGGIGIGGGLSGGGGLDVGIGASASFGVDASAQLGLGFGAGFGGGGDGVAAAQFGFGGATSSSAPAGSPPLAPARAFAADVASRAGAAAAAGVAGASSGLLSPAVGSFARGSGVAFASAAGARAAANLVAFSAHDPEPTRLEGPAWGSQASAGVPAVFGAFAGLQAGVAPPRIRRRIDPNKLLPQQPDAALFASADSAFEIGGRALSTQASGLDADVGVNASLGNIIRFDQE